MEQNPTRKKLWSDAEVDALMLEVLDKSKILLHCPKHTYVASDTPPAPIGCKHCWEAYWWYKIASTPPHLRQERLEQAYAMVSDAVVQMERGEFDIQLYDHPVIETRKNVSDKEIEKEKE